MAPMIDTPNSTPSNADQFLNTFNQIERYLRSTFDVTEHLGFKRLVDRLSRENSLVALYKQDLIEFVELRNAIVHKSTGLPIAEPSNEAVARIVELERKLTNPPMVIDIASKPVYSALVQDNIADVIRTMNAERYAYVPVYDGKLFIGIFSENSLIKWLAATASGERFLIKEQVLNEVKDFFDSQDDKHNTYRFVAQDVDAFTVRDYFTSYLSEKKRLNAVFVTANGSPQEEIIGIVTAWDIHKLTNSTAKHHHA
jgi:predicted transcriptional regulator